MQKTLGEDLLEGGVMENYYQSLYEEGEFFSINDLFLKTREHVSGLNVLEIAGLYAKVNWISSDGSFLKRKTGMYLGRSLKSPRIEMERFEADGSLDLDDPARYGIRPTKKYR